MKIQKLKIIPRYLFRNKYSMRGTKVIPKKVNLEYYMAVKNLGDMLSPVIVEYMLNKRMISVDQVTKTSHLLAVGSIIGSPFDATVWGSGVMSFAQVAAVYKWRKFRKYDIRCVRGPISANVLRSFGYDCPDVYGDPAVLMPLIYTPLQTEKEYDVVYISHIHNKSIPVPEGVKYLDIQTDDYKTFIDEMCKAKKVISSSLHGIILAETYGVPSVFHSEKRENEIIKYYDWYNSTGRYCVSMAKSMEEALVMSPMPLPNVELLQKNLLETFPYDLWEVYKLYYFAINVERYLYLQTKFYLSEVTPAVLVTQYSTVFSPPIFEKPMFFSVMRGSRTMCTMISKIICRKRQKN